MAASEPATVDTLNAAETRSEQSWSALGSGELSYVEAQSSAINSAARAPTAIAGPLVFADTCVGRIKQATTRRPRRPWTLKRASTTEVLSSGPMEQLPVPCRPGLINQVSSWAISSSD